MNKLYEGLREKIVNRIANHVNATNFADEIAEQILQDLSSLPDEKLREAWKDTFLSDYKVREIAHKWFNASQTETAHDFAFHIIGAQMAEVKNKLLPLYALSRLEEVKKSEETFGAQLEDAKRESYDAGLDDATNDAYNAGLKEGNRLKDKAVEQAKKEGIKEVIQRLDAIDTDADDVKVFTRQVCELIVEYQQRLKGQAKKELCLDENGHDVRDLCKKCEATLVKKERERIIKVLEIKEWFGEKLTFNQKYECLKYLRKGDFKEVESLKKEVEE